MNFIKINIIQVFFSISLYIYQFKYKIIFSDPITSILITFLPKKLNIIFNLMIMKSLSENNILN